MPPPSAATRERVAEIAGRHGFSAAAAEYMLGAVARGRGAMAQFDHAEFGGAGQWMRGGMTMVGDMFNSALKARVEALCADLSALVDSEPELTAAAPGALSAAPANPRAAAGAWWPAGLPTPDSTGAQNDLRYAWFAAPRRLAIERAGTVTLYDTLDHRIGGFSQQQSDASTLSFTSQHGPVDVARLPVVSDGRGDQGAGTDAPHAGADVPRAGAAHDVITAIERLAELRARGIVSESEFAAKKAELLGRI
ncbi:MAG: SHOCT domain-containing protein [Pseudomonadota bacterium]|nr:SHOCT domain-containing protein [Pseudomonadota bacterium]